MDSPLEKMLSHFVFLYEILSLLYNIIYTIKIYFCIISELIIYSSTLISLNLSVIRQLKSLTASKCFVISGLNVVGKHKIFVYILNLSKGKVSL